MRYWLVKSEPETYSWDDFVRAKEDTWDGVRNYQARNFMREMKKGDTVLFYHSQSTREVVGQGRVVREAYPDPTATEGDWSCVNLLAMGPLARPVTLAEIKSSATMKDCYLIRNSRLSVMPFTKKEYDWVIKTSKTEASAPQKKSASSTGKKRVAKKVASTANKKKGASSKKKAAKKKSASSKSSGKKKAKKKVKKKTTG